jgi:hypothetical protein
MPMEREIKARSKQPAVCSRLTMLQSVDGDLFQMLVELEKIER